MVVNTIQIEKELLFECMSEKLLSRFETEYKLNRIVPLNEVRRRLGCLFTLKKEEATWFLKILLTLNPNMKIDERGLHLNDIQN